MLLILIQFWYLHNIYMFIAAPRLSSSSSAWAVVRSTPRPSSKAFRTGTPGNKSMATSVCCLSVDLFESIWIYLNLFDLFSCEINGNHQREPSSIIQYLDLSGLELGKPAEHTCDTWEPGCLTWDSSLPRKLADTRGKQLKGPCN